MGKHKSYDEEWLVAALAIGKLSHSEIARRQGLSPAHVARIAAGQCRRDLQPRIQAARTVVADEIQQIAARCAPAVMARHVKLGMEGDGEVARKCREFIIQQARREEDQNFQIRSAWTVTARSSSKSLAAVSVVTGWVKKTLAPIVRKSARL